MDGRPVWLVISLPQDLHGLTSAININLTHNEIDNVTGAFSREYISYLIKATTHQLAYQLKCQTGRVSDV